MVFRHSVRFRGCRIAQGQNERKHMNCTNQNTGTQSPHFKVRCNRMGIYVPGDNPTPGEIIPILERRLSQHMTHEACASGPWSGDYIEWKTIHDEYQEFLTDLRAANDQLVG